ncbi:MAG: hypothetical protein R3C45_19265 [Phycisphaerales bacterium]
MNTGAHGFGMKAGLGVVIFSITALLSGYGLGLKLHIFGYGSWAIWLFATLVFPLVVGLFTPPMFLKNRMLVAVTVYLIALTFNTSMDIGLSTHAYEFAVRHGADHEAALRRPIGFGLWMVGALFSASAPILVIAKSASRAKNEVETAVGVIGGIGESAERGNGGRPSVGFNGGVGRPAPSARRYLSFFIRVYPWLLHGSITISPSGRGRSRGAWCFR